MRNLRKRNPRPKKTVYSINVNPTKTKQFSIKGRKKPRKARLALVKKFNDLVKRGIVSNLKFDKDGSLSAADFSRKLTSEETKLMRKVVMLTQEPYIRRQPPIPKEEIIIEKLRRSLIEHEKKGQFVFIVPRMELDIMEGKNVENIISIAELINGTNFDASRKKIKGFDKAKVQRNLKRQLRYFESILKNKRRKEMIIALEKEEFGEGVTKIKLDGKNVVRETLVRLDTPQKSINADIVSKVILKSNGKIVFETINYDHPTNFKKRF